MFILTTAVIILSIFFLLFLGRLVSSAKTNELRGAEGLIVSAVDSFFEKQGYSGEEISDSLVIPELPYYLTFTVYEQDTENIIASNDPFLPLLNVTDGKLKHYFEKDYFIDGNLDILYYADLHNYGDVIYVCEVAANAERDAFSMIFAKMPRALLLMALPILFLSFLLSLFITKNTIKPVVKITRAAQSMTTENLGGTLPLSGLGDEIDELSRTFNELFMRIKADFDRERQFSSDVSHELNTPLTVISGQANLLLRWGKDNPEQLEKSLNAIKNESKSMHAIIENLLQISRIESGRIKPQFCEVNVRDIFDRVVEEFSAVAPDVKFEVDSEGNELVLINTDPEMLHQILTVLVSNSVKFSGGKCTVRLYAENNGWEVVIREQDDGPGISSEALPHIFERFYRADEAHTRSVGGSGLGLSIAKTLADALGIELSGGNVMPHGAVFELIC